MSEWKRYPSDQEQVEKIPTEDCVEYTTEGFEEDEQIQAGGFPQISTKTIPITTPAPEFRSIPLNLQIPMVILQPAALLPAPVLAAGHVAIVDGIIKRQMEMIILRTINEAKKANDEKKGYEIEALIMEEIKKKIRESKKTNDKVGREPHLTTMIRTAFENLATSKPPKIKWKKRNVIVKVNDKVVPSKGWELTKEGEDFMEKFGDVK